MARVQAELTPVQPKVAHACYSSQWKLIRGCGAWDGVDSTGAHPQPQKESDVQGAVLALSLLRAQHNLVLLTKPCVVPTAQAMVHIDGQSIGYSKSHTAYSSHQHLELEFAGFSRTNRDGTISYTAFKFGALKPEAGASTVEHPDQIAAGRIEVQVDGVVHVGTRTYSDPIDVRWGNDAANKKLPEGKKWFLQPGLKAEVGSTVTKGSKRWGNAVYSSVFKLPVFKLRYDTAENLMLRKILDTSKPAHRAILSASKDARIAAMGRSQSGGVSRQSTIKPEHRMAGVKREREQQRDQRQRENDDDFVIPRSATAETINLIEDTAAPVQPLTVNGHALAADEMAVCDLLDSDDEPDWKVTKKEGAGVVEV